MKNFVIAQNPWDGMVNYIPLTEDEEAVVEAVVAFEGYISEDKDESIIFSTCNDVTNIIVRCVLGKVYGYKEEVQTVLSFFEGLDRSGLVDRIILAVYNKHDKESRFYSWSESAGDIQTMPYAPQVCKYDRYMHIKNVYGRSYYETPKEKTPRKGYKEFTVPCGLSKGTICWKRTVKMIGR